MRSTAGRLLKLALPLWRWMALAALLGFATIGSSIGLMTTSAYLIAKAATGSRLWPVSPPPSIADLQVAIVGVRFFGIARGVFRYLERYVSHDVTFHLLARLRVWFYRSLEPLAPARLWQYRSGDLLSRIGLCRGACAYGRGIQCHDAVYRAGHMNCACQSLPGDLLGVTWRLPRFSHFLQGQ